MRFKESTGLVREMLRTTCVALLAAIALAACGGDDSEEPAAAATNPPTNPPANPPTNPPGGNAAPTISGTPPNSAMQGASYMFAPSATDSNGDTLTFSIVGKPGWATFSTATGQLSGTPSGVGNHTGISITVSDGTATATLGPFSINVVATASGAALLTWVPPTQNTDGSPLGTGLAGYRVYWGTTQGSYPNSVSIGANLSSYMVQQLTPATWYFVLTAVNQQGVESGYSNIATKTVL